MLKKIFKNSSVVVIGDIASKIVGFITFIYLARYLGAQQLGEYNFIFVYFYFFELFIQFGMNSIITREISRNKEKAELIIGNAILIRTIMIIVGTIFSCLIITFLRYPSSTKILIYMGCFSLFFNLRTIFEAIFKVNLEMFYSSGTLLMKKILYGALCFLVIVFKGSLIHLVLATLFSGLVELCLIIYFSSKFVRPRFKYDFDMCKLLLKESLPLAFSAAFTAIYFRIDIFMLSLMKGYESIGYYSAAYNLTESLNIIPISLSVSIFPLLSNYFHNLKDSFASLLQRTLEFMLLLALPIAIGTSLLSPKIIALFYGNKYALSHSCLSILVWVTAIMFFNIILTNALVAAGRQLIDMIISISAAVLNIVLNYFLIPRFDFNGAAVATGITEILNLVLFIYFVNRLSRLRISFWVFGKVILANVVLIIFLIYFSWLSIFLIIPLAVLLYFGLILAFKVVDKDKISFFKRSLSTI